MTKTTDSAPTTRAPAGRTAPAAKAKAGAGKATTSRAAKSPAAKSGVADKPAPRKRTPTPSRRGTSRSMPVSLRQVHEMIAEAAYIKAESRGFSPEGCLDDWLEAEREVESRLSWR